MSNINRATYDDCDHRGYAGCTSCGCSECGALVDRDLLGPLTLPSGRVVQACGACLAAGSPRREVHRVGCKCCLCTGAEEVGIPPICSSCGGRTDGVKPAPTFTGMRLAACDCEDETVETRTLSDAELMALRTDVA